MELVDRGDSLCTINYCLLLHPIYLVCSASWFLWPEGTKVNKYLITIVKKQEELRIIEVHAVSRDEAEDRALEMQSRWNDLPTVEDHSESYIDSIKEVS